MVRMPTLGLLPIPLKLQPSCCSLCCVSSLWRAMLARMLRGMQVCMQSVLPFKHLQTHFFYLYASECAAAVCDAVSDFILHEKYALQPHRVHSITPAVMSACSDTVPRGAFALLAGLALGADPLGNFHWDSGDVTRGFITAAPLGLICEQA